MNRILRHRRRCGVVAACMALGAAGPAGCGGQYVGGWFLAPAGRDDAIAARSGGYAWAFDGPAFDGSAADLAVCAAAVGVAVLVGAAQGLAEGWGRCEAWWAARCGAPQ